PTPPSPTATLSPYTTLFRSAKTNLIEHKDVELDVDAFFCLSQGSLHLRKSAFAISQKLDMVTSAREGVIVLRANGQQRLKPRHLDRKSTRLNSSHVKISYAV